MLFATVRTKFLLISIAAVFTNHLLVGVVAIACVKIVKKILLIVSLYYKDGDVILVAVDVGNKNLVVDIP